MANTLPHGQRRGWGKIIRGMGVIVILASWMKHIIGVWENLSQFTRILYPLKKLSLHKIYRFKALIIVSLTKTKRSIAYIIFLVGASL